MRTNIDLDDALVDEAMRVSGAKTKKEVVDRALRELIRAARKRDIFDLVGKVQFYDGFDPKKHRKTRYDLD